MEGDTDAPAERHPIGPPHLGRDRQIDEEKDQHRRHIGEEVNGEAPRLPVDEDALSPPRLAQEKREGMSGERGAPAERDPRESQKLIAAQVRTPAMTAARWMRKRRIAKSLTMSLNMRWGLAAVLRVSNGIRAFDREHDREPRRVPPLPPDRLHIFV